MANYIYIDNYANKGKLGISVSTFNSLVSDALNNVTGVKVAKKKKAKNFFEDVAQKVFQLNKPVNTTISNGIVHIQVVVDVIKGTNLQEVTRIIQEEVSNAILLATEQVPFDVQVKVASIIEK